MSKIGLALGGGGSKGAFQAGALLHMYNLEYMKNINMVAGISVGSLNATKVVEEDILGLVDLWKTIENKDIYKNRYSWLLSPLLLFGGSSFKKNDPLRKLIKKHVDWSRVRNSSKRLLIGATSLSLGEVQYFSNKIPVTNDLLQEALLASSAIPAAFPPSEIMEQQFVDGGVVNMNPLNVLIKNGCDKINKATVAEERISALWVTTCKTSY